MVQKITQHKLAVMLYDTFYSKTNLVLSSEVYYNLDSLFSGGALLNTGSTKEDRTTSGHD